MMDKLTKQAIDHTLHCLLGCSIGEILGMVVSTAFGWSNYVNIFLSVALAFFFGYLLTFRSIYSKNHSTKNAIKTSAVTDTASITSMEIVDNLFILAVPGAINAQLVNSLFWASLAVSLAIAFIITVPVNRWFMAHSGHSHIHQH
jgi:uncharacterized membrane protein YgaE (UPF0421/DUF939 family)